MILLTSSAVNWLSLLKLLLSYVCLRSPSKGKKKKKQEIYVGESRGTLAAEADIRFFSPTLFDSRDGLRRNRETARGLI